MKEVETKLQEVLRGMSGRRDFYLDQYQKIMSQQTFVPPIVLECYCGAVFMSATCERLLVNIASLAPVVQKRFVGMPERAEKLLRSLQQEMTSFFEGRVNMTDMIDLHNSYIEMNHQIVQLIQQAAPQGVTITQSPSSSLH